MDVDDVYRRIREAQRASYDLQAELGPAFRRVLTGSQFRRLPANLARALDAKLIQEAARSAGVR